MNPLDAIARVAVALGPLADRVVFLGGAAAPLMITDRRSEGVRPTDDVDVVAEVKTRTAFGAFEAELRARGFAHDTSEGAPICRWRCGDLIVDVMPPDASVLGFTNRWYAYVLETARWVTLPAGPRVRAASAVAFVATKLDAFQSPTRRFAGDVWASHDLEDLLTVLHGRAEFDAELADARADVRAFVVGSLSDLLARPDFADAVEGHLEPGPSRTELARRLLSRLRALAALSS